MGGYSTPPSPSTTCSPKRDRKPRHHAPPRCQDVLRACQKDLRHMRRRWLYITIGLSILSGMLLVICIATFMWCRPGSRVSSNPSNNFPTSY